MELLPNWLCSYLFELSQVFHCFDDQVPVLKAGLGLLRIAMLERMWGFDALVKVGMCDR